jgi:hypothetical protein
MKTNTIYIPPEFLELEVECYECPFANTPDVVTGHLAESHGYSLRQVQDWLQDWTGSFETDDQGFPLQLDECPNHGPIRIGEVCQGCEASEDEVERALEAIG